MSAGFLGRLYRLGRNLVSYGLGGGSSAPAVTPIVEVCVSRTIHAGPTVVRRIEAVAVTREIDLDIAALRPIQPGPRVTRIIPSC